MRTAFTGFVFAYLLSRWWSSWEGISSSDLIGGRVSLGAGFEVSKAHLFLVSFPCHMLMGQNVSSQLLLWPACCHAPCHDGHDPLEP